MDPGSIEGVFRQALRNGGRWLASSSRSFPPLSRVSTEYAKVIRRIVVSEKFVIGWSFELGRFRVEITGHATRLNQLVHKPLQECENEEI